MSEGELMGYFTKKSAAMKKRLAASKPRFSLSLGKKSGRKTLQPSGPIIWAMDPDQKRLGDFNRVADFIRLWSDGFECPVLPISIIPLSDGLGSGGNLKEQVQRVETKAQKTFEEQFKKIAKFDLKRLLSPRVIVRLGATLREAAEDLVDAAIENKASFIAVSTNARKGIKRLALGSFTEALIATSPVPVMTVNPKTVVPDKIKSLLFPTDFSKYSEEIFVSILDWAAKIGAQMIIFHRFEGALPLGFYGEFGLGIDAGVVRRFEREAKLNLQKHTQEWRRLAAEKGVKLRVISSEKFPEIADGVLETAKEHDVGAIILANHRGPLGQAFFGSAARNVLAQAKCPVLVIHT